MYNGDGMDWIKVTIYTNSAGIGPVSDALSDLGITGIEIEDEAEFNSFMDETSEFWDYVDDDLRKRMQGETRIIAYICDDTSGKKLLSDIRRTMAELRSGDFGRLAIETEPIKTEDWANAWRDYFHATEVGEKLFIRPQWDMTEVPEGRVLFNINPGMSFGTGSHETTQLCLEQLEKYVTKGCRMLDLGCGSGILSVVSLLLGAAEAVGVDIDPNCVDTAYENADMNNIDRDKYTVISGNILTDESVKAVISRNRYEVVAANIVADVIIGLAPAARRYMAEGGVFIASGIIDGRQDEVIAALTAEGFTVTDTKRRKDWWAVVCK